MLADDAFLRHMPRVIPLEARLRLDALVMSADIAETAYVGLWNLIAAVEERVKEKATHPTREMVIELALRAWAIVDQAHNFRQGDKNGLLEGVPSYQAFVKKYDAVTRMRNGMDHLPQNIGNSARRRGSGHTMHGALAYTTSVGPSTWSMQIVTFGAMQHDGMDTPTVNSAELPQDGIGQISLAAFGYQIDLRQLATDIRDTAERLNSACEAYFKKQIMASAGSAIVYEEVMGNTVVHHPLITVQVSITPGNDDGSEVAPKHGG